MKKYTVVKGDSLWRIASKLYGDGHKYKLILEANREIIQDERLIYTGQVFLIPDLIEVDRKIIDNNKLFIPGKEKDQLTIVIKGKEFEGFENFRLNQAMDVIADGWNCSMAYNIKDKEIVDIFKPYSYNESLVYIGGNIIDNGILYNVSPELSQTKRIIKLEGWTKTADIIDSVSSPPYEFSNMNIKDISKSILSPFSLDIIFDNDPGPVFDRVTIEPTESVGQFLANLATQRGLLISSNEKGQLVFWTGTTSAPLFTLEEGGNYLLSIPAINYDGRSIFNTYKAIGQSPGNSSNSAISIDNEIPKVRKMTFTADDTTDANIKDSADWKRDKARADSFNISLQVSGWRDPNGNLYKKNTRMILKSETAGFPDGINLLIKAVEFSMSNSGKQTTLSVVKKY